MKQYLFWDGERDKTNFHNIVNYFFGIFAVIMLALAFVVMLKDSFLFAVLVLIGVFLFPGVPLVLKYYKKMYYVTLMDDSIICKGKPNNLFGKTEMLYEDIFYIEKGRRKPIICPRGTTPEQMEKEFGGFINVYDKDRKYLFSFREDEVMINKIYEKNPNIEIIEYLDGYHW